jgi:DNA-binding transcriptional regulator YiaG
MKRKNKKSIGQQIIESLQEAVDSLRSGASIEETFTCHRVDVNAKPRVYDAQVVKDTRKLLRASQTVFAKFLGVSAQTVRAWEQGENEPSDMAKRFMDEIRHNPDYWRGRLRDIAIVKKRVPISAA